MGWGGTAVVVPGRLKRLKSGQRCDPPASFQKVTTLQMRQQSENVALSITKWIEPPAAGMCDDNDFAGAAIFHRTPSTLFRVEDETRSLQHSLATDAIPQFLDVFSIHFCPGRLRDRPLFLYSRNLRANYRRPRRAKIARAGLATVELMDVAMASRGEASLAVAGSSAAAGTARRLNEPPKDEIRE